MIPVTVSRSCTAAGLVAGPGRREALAALFLALGGSPGWFRQHVLPWLEVWSRRWPGSAPPLITCRSCAADDSGSPPPAAVAPAAQAWLQVLHAAVQLASAMPRTQSPAWRLWQVHRALEAQATDLACALQIDPWQVAAATLVRQGRWHARSLLGRWVPGMPLPRLLWPLAGRDLLAALPDSAPAVLRALTVDSLPRHLCCWGHVPAQGLQPVPYTRSDGREVQVLAVRPSLLRACSPAEQGALLAPGAAVVPGQPVRAAVSALHG